MYKIYIKTVMNSFAGKDSFRSTHFSFKQMHHSGIVLVCKQTETEILKLHNECIEKCKKMAFFTYCLKFINICESRLGRYSIVIKSTISEDKDITIFISTGICYIFYIKISDQFVLYIIRYVYRIVHCQKCLFFIPFTAYCHIHGPLNSTTAMCS